MKYDDYGQAFCTSEELVGMLYADPKLDLSLFKISDPDTYNNSVTKLYAEQHKLEKYVKLDISVEEFDQLNQSQWNMPDEYSELDIAQYILDLCKTDAELQRVGEELLLYMDRDLFNLLRYLKYFVDTMRANNIVWGLGRGSSVASYVLYLLGVHKINSLYYDLPIEEFLK